jgi:hypothetical protein
MDAVQFTVRDLGQLFEHGRPNVGRGRRGHGLFVRVVPVGVDQPQSGLDVAQRKGHVGLDDGQINETAHVRLGSGRPFALFG